MKSAAASVLSLVLLAPSASVLAQSSGSGYTSPQAAQLQITQKTDAPGLSLTPGTYSIRISDRLNDRIIVQLRRTEAKMSLRFWPTRIQGCAPARLLDR